MAKINNAFCKLLLPKEANKCRRQGKPSFCVKALHTQASAIMNRRAVSFASVCVCVCGQSKNSGWGTYLS